MQESRRLNSNGVNLHIAEWGNPEQPTLLMVHGYPDSMLVWRDVADKLSTHLHVVAYDVRGAGLSDTPTARGAYSLPQLATDLKLVIEELSPDKPIHLLAHDWGSIQSWEVVTDPGMSSRIASFTSISGPCLDHVGHWMRSRLRSGKLVEFNQALKQLASSWYIGFFQLPLLPSLLWRFGLLKAWPLLLKRSEGIQKQNTRAEATLLRKNALNGIQLYRENVALRLRAPRDRHTDIPVQLIVPTRDKFLRPPLYQDMGQWVTSLQRIDIDAGHWLPLSHPDWLAERVLAFVQSSPPDKVVGRQP